MILQDYLSALDKLERVIDKHDFKTVVKLVELYLEAIFNSDYLYDKLSLLKIYDRRNEHIRYLNFIEKFYKDLRRAISDKRNSVKNIFERKGVDKTSPDINSQPKLNIEFVSMGNSEELEKPRRETYHYEIGKIATKRNSKDFEFFGGILRAKCQNNDLILQELEHMEQNIHDEIEYYTSLRLICSELKEE